MVKLPKYLYLYRKYKLHMIQYSSKGVRYFLYLAYKETRHKYNIIQVSLSVLYTILVLDRILI